MSDIQAETGQYTPGEHPDLPAPPASTGVLGWIRTNLIPSFKYGAITGAIVIALAVVLVLTLGSSPLVAIALATLALFVVNWILGKFAPNLAIMGQTLLTIISAVIAWWIVSTLLQFAIFDAIWSAKGKDDCLKSPDGACWGFITARFEQFMYGFYPEPERWRVDLWSVILTVGIAALIFPEGDRRRPVALGLIGFTALLYVWQLAAGAPDARALLWMAAPAALGLLLLLPAAGMRGAVGLSMLLVVPLLSFWLLVGEVNIIVPFVMPVVGILLIAYAPQSLRSLGFYMVVAFGVIIGLVVVNILISTLSKLGVPLIGNISDGLGWLLGLYFSDWGLGSILNFTYVETDKWGGLMLTMVIAITGIAASLPLGVLLALGRRSNMPIIKTFCVIFIEFWRGVPLITVLFMASVMFPLFLPEGVTFNQLVRALIGVALFSAAYMAEVVRGGLQALPRGQYEAADALGLNYFKSMRLIILPQALKIVIPGIVNTFIGLFKDTTLVAIIGLIDFLGQVDAGLRDGNWQAPNVPYTGYLFAALVYFIFCYGMSRYSVSVERRLDTGHKR